MLHSGTISPRPKIRVFFKYQLHQAFLSSFCSNTYFKVIALEYHFILKKCKNQCDLLYDTCMLTLLSNEHLICTINNTGEQFNGIRELFTLNLTGKKNKIIPQIHDGEVSVSRQGLHELTPKFGTSLSENVHLQLPHNFSWAKVCQQYFLLLNTRVCHHDLCVALSQLLSQRWRQNRSVSSWQKQRQSALAKRHPFITNKCFNFRVPFLKLLMRSLQDYNCSILTLFNCIVDSYISVIAWKKLLVNCSRIFLEAQAYFAAIVEPHSPRLFPQPLTQLSEFKLRSCRFMTANSNFSNSGKGTCCYAPILS